MIVKQTFLWYIAKKSAVNSETLTGKGVVEMREIRIDQGWKFKHGMYTDMSALMRADDTRIVNLPHDYMIESEVTKDAPAL